MAVLGAGIMGSCLALYLARKGLAVSLFDMAPRPMNGASRWNEGKIHLGFLYAADPGLATAKRMIPGGLAFGRLMSDLLDQPLQRHATQQDDIFLIHRESLVPAEQARNYYRAVNDLVRGAPGARQYLADARNARVQELPRNTLGSMVDPELVQAGFRVPERSVQTTWIADQLCGALAAERRIEQRMNTRISGVAVLNGPGAAWEVQAEEAREPFDYVVNALWHGGLEIDRTAGLEPEGEWSNRYRLALFVRTARDIDVSSAVLAVGPFGDIKNYNGRDFYLSWYPAGLIHESENVAPDLEMPGTTFEPAQTRAAIIAGLTGAFRGLEPVFEYAEETRVAGGYVFAQGRGSLANPASTLHRRDRFGVRRLGRYFSIDTGKYSTAPWLARSIAGEIAAG